MRKRIDLNALLMGGSRSPGAVKAYRIGKACESYWKASANKNLTDVSPKTRQAYIRNIRMESSQKGVRIALRGFIGNLIEQGMGPGGIGTQGTYDARKFILKPPYARIRGKRRTGYKVIPFSRGSVTSIGKKFGKGALSAARAAANDKARIRAGASPFMSRRGMGSAKKDILVRDRATGRTVRFRAHSADALAGAKVEVGTYSVASPDSARFTVFRAMSTKGKPWMTRGVRARRLAKKLDWKKIMENARRAGGQR